MTNCISYVDRQWTLVTFHCCNVSFGSMNSVYYRTVYISRFDMSCAQAHWVRSKPIMQLKLHEPTMAIGYSLRMCARRLDSTNPGRSNLVFRSKPIAEVEMSNRLIAYIVVKGFWCHMTTLNFGVIIIFQLLGPIVCIACCVNACGPIKEVKWLNAAECQYKNLNCPIKYFFVCFRFIVLTGPLIEPGPIVSEGGGRQRLTEQR